MRPTAVLEATYQEIQENRRNHKWLHFTCAEACSFQTLQESWGNRRLKQDEKTSRTTVRAISSSNTLKV